MWFLLLTVLGCGSSNEGAQPSQGAASTPPSSSTPTPPPAEPAATPTTPRGEQVAVDLAAGAAWGAVFWRDGVAWQRGGGTALVGPGGAGEGKQGAETGACGVKVEGAPARVVLAVPAGKSATAPPEAPATRAEVVERAAWRLDEVLPPRDRFSPAISGADPALQRGVRVASVAKTRRSGAPPVLLSSGARDCVGAVVALDQDAGTVLSWDRIEEACEPLSLVPAADYDGDGVRELAAWSETRVLLYSLEERPGVFRLRRVGDWRCP